MGLVAPSSAAAFTSLEPKGRIGRSEIRATYGGLFAAMGGYCLVAREPMVYTVLGVGWMGAAAGRLASVAADRSVAAKNLGGIVFEAAIGALLLAPVYLAG